MSSSETMPDREAETDSSGGAQPDSSNEATSAKRKPRASSLISWTMINFWLDGSLGVVFLAGLWTLFVTRFVFPPGTAAEGWRLWGFTYDQWSDLTFILFCVLAGGVVVHVMLHWSWVCGVITGKLMPKRDGKKRLWNDGERTLIGVGLVVVILHLLGGAFAYAMLTVQGP